MPINQSVAENAAYDIPVKSNPLFGFFTIEVEDATTFRFGAVNDKYARFLNATPASLAGTALEEIFSAQDLAVLTSNFRRVMHLKQPLTYDEVLFLDHGRIWWQIYLVPQLENGVVTRLVGTVSNMTDTKRLERALQESERKNRVLISSMPDAILKLNYQGVFLDIEEGKDTVLGISPIQFMGRTIEDVLPLEMAFKSRQALETAFRTQQTQNFEYSLNLNGQLHDFEIRLVVINREECLAIVRDITVKNQALRELEIAKEQAEAANKAKSAFLATVSHELRTPLNAILGFSDVLRNQMFGPLGYSKYHDYACDIFASGAHLLEIINDIIDLSRLESNTAELQEDIFDINKHILSAYKPFEDKAQQSGLKVSFELADELPLIQADRRGVKQILTNVISNAIKFTPEKGKIVIETRREPAGSLTVIITDTGIGMNPRDIPRAMAPFQQIECSMRRFYQGTGLGLTLVKSLMELHGGTIDIKSRKNIGTSVFLRFPLKRSVLQTQNAPQPAASSGTAQTTSPAKPILHSIIAANS